MLWKVEMNFKLGNHIVPHRGLVVAQNAFVASDKFIRSLDLLDGSVCTRVSVVPIKKDVYPLR